MTASVLTRNRRLAHALALLVGMSVVMMPASPTAQVNRPEKPVTASLADGQVMPIVQEQVLPAYPTEAVASAARGVIEIEVVVGGDGSLLHSRVARPRPPLAALERAALDAVSRWRFRGAMRAGRPVTTLSIVRMTFVPPGPSGGNAVVTATLQPPARTPEDPDDGAGLPTVVYAPRSPGVRDPVLVRNVTPQYTPDAMRAKIMGTVELSIIIRADGTVSHVRVTKSLDAALGLDREALIAARHWFFEPATRNGDPVTSRATLVLEFRLH